MSTTTLSLAVAALSGLLTAGSPALAPAAAPPHAGVGAEHARTAPIRTRPQLDAYMKSHATTPLDRLSPGARERFLLSLIFGRDGLGEFDPADLTDELTNDEIRQVLMLFGPEIVAYAPKSHSHGRAPAVAERTSRMSDLERRYNQFYRTSIDARRLDDSAYTAILAERFDALFLESRDPAALRLASDRDLRLLSRAAQETARRSLRPEHVDAYRNLFAERKRRGQVGKDDVGALRDLLLATHRFEEARELSTSYPEAGLPRLPEFIDPLAAANGRATVWRLDDDGKSLTRTVVDLAPTQIIVTASCHFSVDAAEDITGDPVLGPVFASRARWLTLPPGRERIDLAREWNRRFPRAQVTMAYDQREWALLPSWSTPVFYFVRDGKVVDRVTGWRRGVDAESRQPLISALRRNGLLDEAQPPPP
jgi:hypothetical protein